MLDMPNTLPPTTSAEALAEKRRLAAQSSLVDFGLFFGLTETNVQQALDAEGVAGIKIYLGSSTGGLLVTSEPVLEQVFRDARMPIVVHAEQESLIQERRPAFGPNPPATAHSEDPQPRRRRRGPDAGPGPGAPARDAPARGARVEPDRGRAD